jgi:hypothetical protein
MVQTNAVKEWLRGRVVQIVNNEINGKLSIGKIDGTIFSSIELMDVSLLSNSQDTVAYFSHLIVKTSPLKLLFKDIYVRQIVLENAIFNLREEADGELNISKIFPPSDEPEDTTETEFPFTISVADLNIKNLSFCYQSFENINSEKIYNSLNSDDLRISDFDLSLSAFVNLTKNEFRLNISRFDFKPNLEFFELKNFSGNFLLTKNSAMIDNLNIETQKTNLQLTAAITDVDFINEFTMNDLGKAPLRLNLSISNFHFNDLSSFVESTNFLNGEISGGIAASGSLNQLSVDKLDLLKGQTNIVGKAKLENLLDGDNLSINAEFDNSTVLMRDVSDLLKDFSIPDYNIGLIKFNKLRYNGKPSEFVAEASFSTSRGNLSLKSSFDLKPAKSKYDISISTENLNLSSIINFNTKLNSEIKISGNGFDIESINGDVSIICNNSRFENFNINALELNSKMNDMILSFDLDLVSDTASASASGKIDFIRNDDPFFTLNANFHSFDISKIISDSSLVSNINATLDLEGRGFDVDSMNLFMVMDIEKSSFNFFNIDSTRLIVDVRRNDNGNKVMNLVSNVADFTIKGNYKLSTLIESLTSRAELVANQLKAKLSKSIQQDANVSTPMQELNTVNQIFEAKLLLDFKDFVPLKIDEKNLIEIGGEIRGDLVSEENFVLLKLDSDINYLKLLLANELYFITKTKIDFSLKQFNTLQENFNTEVVSKVKSERIYVGTNIYNFNSEISLTGDSLNISSKGSMEDYLSFDIISKNIFDEYRIKSIIDSLRLNYNDIIVSNDQQISLSYSKGDMLFENFKLNVAGGKFNVEGSFGESQSGELSFNLQDVQSNEFIDKLLHLPPQNKINSLINLSGKVTGSFGNPKVIVNSTIEDISINDRLLGTINTFISYSNDKLDVDFSLQEEYSNTIKDRLSIKGYIPLRNNDSKKDSINNTEQIELEVIADDLYLTPLGKLIPEAEISEGFLESEVLIGGTLSKPSIVGYLNINDLLIKPSFNNLSYYFNSKLYWDDDTINIEQLSVTNDAKTQFGGVINGDGFIVLRELSPDSIFIRAAGNLKVLDQISKEVNQFIYGDLSFETKSDIIFKMNSQQINLQLPLNITRADLVLPLARTAYSNTSDIIYRFAENVEKSGVESELEKLIEEYQKKKIETSEQNGSRSFDYNIDVGIKNEAKVVVILSKELNQDLTTLLSGNIILSSRDGITRTSGQFNLLEGSKLSFIKSFEARGNVRFENINNPLLDITATYRDYYYPVTETGQSTEQEVAVKIKLKGPLNELNQNFVKDPQNIGVYVGTENIQKDQRDETKTPTDALFFIIAGKFTDGATLQERSTVASTATSFAGSLIGNVLNQYLGDYVRSLQLRQFGDQTKFNLIGRVGNFRYEIGGTTEVFQDLSRANVKIELPIKQRLILRLERKESFTDQSTVNASLYNEFGVKYKFEF